MVVPVRVPFMGQTELFDFVTVYKEMTNAKLNCLCYIAILETILLRANE